MAGLFMGGGNTTVGTRYGSLSVQTSEQGVPIPIVYGSVKICGNLIWYGDFQSHEHESGGKGGGPTVTTYTFSCAVAIGVCEGPITSYGQIWLVDGVSTPAAKNFTEFLGTGDQTAWWYLTTMHPDEALNYRYLAYLASGSLDLGNMNTLPQMWFEVVGFLADTGVITGTAGPAEVVYDFLTNTRYGCGFPASKIDTTSLFSSANSFKNYCGVNGIGFAMAIRDSKPARQHLDDWLQATNTAAVWSDGTLKFIPYGDLYMHRDTYTYTPDATVQYELTEEDFLFSSGEEPVVVQRADPYDCYNNVKLKVTDSSNNYNPSVCETKDQASIELVGLRTMAQIDASFIATPTAGMMSASLVMNRQLYPRSTYMFRLSWAYARLEPLDLVSLTMPSMGLDKLPVRIIEIQEDDAGLMQVTAEEYLAGSQWSVQFPPQGTSGYIGNSQMPPGQVNYPIVFEPTSSQLGLANPQVWIVVSGPAATWGGARIWMSTDGGTNYTPLGYVNAGAITGYVTGAIGAGDTSMTVDVSECGGILSSVTAGDAALGRTAMLVGSEVVAYTTATLTSSGHYTLSGLVRGMYGTTAQAHPVNSRFGYLARYVFTYTVPNASYYGKTVHLKFTSVNTYGGAEQELADVADYSYTITGEGSARSTSIPASITGKPAAAAVVLTYIAPASLTIPANFAGSSIAVGTNPAAAATFTFRKNGSAFGTAVISTSGATAFSCSQTSFAAGDVMTIVAPTTQDATLANLALLIKAATVA